MAKGKSQSRSSNRGKKSRKAAAHERRGTSERRSTKQRRRNQRLNVSKRVDYVFNDKKQFGYTKDIGARGLFLRKLIPERTELELTITLDDHLGAILIPGRVVRTSRSSADKGVAIVFDADATEACDAIADYVLDRLEAKAQARLKANSKNVKVLLELAEIAGERGMADAAINYYQRIVGLEPDARHARARLAELAFERAQRAGQESLFHEALRHIEAAIAAGADLGASHSACQRAIADSRAGRDAALHEQREQEEAERRAQQEEIASAARTTAALRDDNETLERQLEELRRRAENLESERGALEERVAELNQQAGDTRVEMERGRAAAGSRVEEQKLAFEAERADHERVASELDAARTRLDSQADELSEMHEQLDSSRRDLAAIGEQSAHRERELAELRAQMVTSAETTATELEELRSAMHARTAALERARSDNDARDGELSDLRAKLANAESDVARARDLLGERERELEEARALGEQHEARARDRERRIDGDLADLNRLREKLGRDRERIIEHERELAERRETLEHSRRELDDERATVDQERSALSEREAGWAEERRALETDLSTRHDQLLVQEQQLARAREELHDDVHAGSEQLAQREQELLRAEASFKEREELARPAPAPELDATKRELAETEARLRDAWQAEAEARATAEERTRELEASDARVRTVEEQLETLRAATLRSKRDNLAAALRRVEDTGGPDISSAHEVADELDVDVEELDDIDEILEIPEGRDGPTLQLTGEDEVDEEILLTEVSTEALTAQPEPMRRTTAELQLTADDVVQGGSLLQLTDEDVVTRVHHGPAVHPWADSDDTATEDVPDDRPTQQMRLSRRQSLGLAYRSRIEPALEAVGRRLRRLWRGADGFIDPRRVTATAIAAVLTVSSVLAIVVLMTSGAREIELSADERAEIALAERLVAAAKPPSPTSSRLAVSREVIVRHVKAASMKELRVCWTAARARGDLESGDHTFILGWTIREDGTVTGAELTEPNEHADTTLGQCMNAAVETWTFPAGSPRESIVRRFPLGPVKLR